MIDEDGIDFDAADEDDGEPFDLDDDDDDY